MRLVRNLSLTLEGITESAATVIPVLEKPLISQAKVAVNNRVALDDVLAEGESVLWPTPPAGPRLTLLGRLELSYTGSLRKLCGLKTRLFQWGLPLT